MKTLKVYIAGKVDPNSSLGRHDWRDHFCEELSQQSGYSIVNLDPTKSHDGFNLDENNAKLIVGRDCFMIKSADLVIVNLTDDISVGGSQEMLIAKHYRKPLVGIAPKGGKFNKPEKEILGKVYKDWIHPFVLIPCDRVVVDIDGVIKFIHEYFPEQNKVKDLSILDDAQTYYEREHHHLDKMLHHEKTN